VSPAAAFVLAGCLLGIGIWGRRRAPGLVAAWLDAESRELRVRSLRRGATLCLVFGGVFGVAAGFLVVRLLAGP
jgi:hypothetical protein